MVRTGQSEEAAAHQPITAVLADQSELFRAGMRALIDSDPRCTIVDETECPADLARSIRSHNPDVLITDVCFHGVHVLPQLERLCQFAADGTRVLVVSSHEQLGLVRETMRMGVHGYVPKDASVEELYIALRTVADGSRYLHPNLGCAMLDDRETPSITTREGEVVALVARGLTTNEVADRLFISPRSVEGARASAIAKVGATSRAELFAFAHANDDVVDGCGAHRSDATD